MKLTSSNSIDYLTPSVRKEAENISIKHGAFQLFYLTADLIIAKDAKERSALVLHEIVMPLLNNAEVCYLYNDGRDKQLFAEHLDVLTKEGNKYAMSITPQSIESAAELWIAVTSRRGTIVWVSPTQAISFNSLCERAYAAQVTENLGAGMSKSAIKWGKHYVDMYPDKICFGLSRSSGVSYITIFMNRSIIAKTFIHCLECIAVRASGTSRIIY